MTRERSALEEARHVLSPRPFPRDEPGQPRKTHRVQVPSDKMRDHALDLIRILIGTVPDVDFHWRVTNTIHDLVIDGERTLCQKHGVETEHAQARSVAVKPQREKSRSGSIPTT